MKTAGCEKKDKYEVCLPHLTFVTTMKTGGCVKKYELRLPFYLSTIGIQLPSLQANSVRLQPVSDIIAEYDVEHLAVKHFTPLKSYIFP